LGYGGVDLKRWLKKFDEVRDRDEAEKQGSFGCKVPESYYRIWDSDIVKAPPRICTAC
jgi:hypothetical protein